MTFTGVVLLPPVTVVGDNLGLHRRAAVTDLVKNKLCPVFIDMDNLSVPLESVITHTSFYQRKHPDVSRGVLRAGTQNRTEV